jgi:PIN domain nuclease of toxin-antitoxin system
MRKWKTSLRGVIDGRLLLDTAVLIYAVESPEKLSRRVAAALQNDTISLELSAVSLTEIAIKNKVGKLTFPAEVVRRAIESLGIRIVPYTAEHAFHLFELPLHHRDPFDRQIIAQALVEKIPVVTPDRTFGRYEGLKLVW